MKQSTFRNLNSRDLHVAIIMDGSGRWALERGWARTLGHCAGVTAVRRAIHAADRLGVGTLTLFAFSSDNWRRPPKEIVSLMEILTGFLLSDGDLLASQNIRISVIGRRDRLPASLVKAIEEAEELTASAHGMQLRLAVDYSARENILQALKLMQFKNDLSVEGFTRTLARLQKTEPRTAEIDLLIRTGGEKRLSDFLLWESAYAELIFTSRLWPDFSESDLEAALVEFHARERRFGTLSSGKKSSRGKTARAAAL